MRAKEPQKPLLLVDVDGVISLFAAPEGAPVGVRPVEGSFHSIDGIPHFLSSTAARHLLELATVYDLVWASGWEEKADEHLPYLLGLPPRLPFIRFPARVRGTRADNAHWKLQAIDAYAGPRALAWVDDALNDACHEWAGGREAPTLLVQTSPELGLTRRETSTLRAWARELRTGSTAPRG